MIRSTTEKTAVLYFSLSPTAEAKNKTFATGQDFRTNVTIAKLMRSHVLRQIKRSELPFTLFDEKNQKGRSFGEKLTNAYKALFDKGYQYIIAVGNDTPQLTADHLVKADQALQSGCPSVIGPSKDGGIWLLGLSRSAFNPTLIESISWNKKSVFSELSHLFGHHHQTLTLEKLADIDNSVDLDDFLKNRDASSDISRLRQIIAVMIALTILYSQSPYVHRKKASKKTPHLRRAPPPTV